MGVGRCALAIWAFHRRAIDPAQERELAVHIDFESVGGVALRDQVEIGQGHRIPEREFSGARFRQLFKSLETFSDPVLGPANLGRAVFREVLNDVQILQRLDSGVDQFRESPNMGALQRMEGRSLGSEWISSRYSMIAVDSTRYLSGVPAGASTLSRTGT